MFDGDEGRSTEGGSEEDWRVEDSKDTGSLVVCVESSRAEEESLSEDGSGMSWGLREGFVWREGRWLSTSQRTSSSVRITVTVYHLRALAKRRLIPS